MKFKRSERLIDMSFLLQNSPHTLYPLSYFTDRYVAAKSSISEDLAILGETLVYQDLGLIRSYAGATGGVEYIPAISVAKQKQFVAEMIDRLQDESRLLPGGYLYMTDIIGDPVFLNHFGLIFASYHQDQAVDLVLTVETKGIPLANALARYLNAPTLFARKSSKVTEGSTISVKYSSQSSPRTVQSMEIGRNAIKPGANIILLDDFLRGGGTMNGLTALADIFQANVLAKYTLCENRTDQEPSGRDIKSLINITGLDLPDQDLKVSYGSLFD